MEFIVITWNLFHGRDAPPEPGLQTWRSRLLGRTERGRAFAQVNRELFEEFVAILSRTEWDVALLQECPPRWARLLAEEFRADRHLVLTARNRAAWLRSAIARRSPDLLGSAEGGSNLTLIRGEHAPIALRRSVALRPGPGAIGSVLGRPERRAMAFTECASGLCVANLHATNDRPELAAAEVEQGARTATEWAGDRPLLFGGDLNLRPAGSPRPFARLSEDLGLSAPQHPTAIDHILARGLEFVTEPAAWEPERRDIADDDMRLRLSDHAPVEARLRAA